MMKINPLIVRCSLAIITLGVFITSLYLQYKVGLQPCPLCLMQRFCVILLLLLCLLTVMPITLRTLKRFTLLQILFASAGLYFSLRQLWLLTLPSGQMPACMPGLDILIQYFPWQTVAQALFWGSGDCSESPWRLFGLSLPGWSTLYFSLMWVACFILYKKTGLPSGKINS